MAIVAIATSRHKTAYMQTQSRTHIAVVMVVTSKKHLELKFFKHKCYRSYD